MAFSLACDAGKTTLRIEGTDNNVTWNDVANAGAGSVTVDGGGTEDPSFFVTEHVANGTYQVLKNIQFGDGTNALTFYSKNEAVYFVASKIFEIKNNATLSIGEKINDWGSNGSMWSLDCPTGSNYFIAVGSDAANLGIYGSIFLNRGTNNVYFAPTDGNTEYLNSIFLHWNRFYFASDENQIAKKCYFCDSYQALVIVNSPDTFIDNFIHEANNAVVAVYATTTVENVDYSGSSIDLYVYTTSGHLTLKNPRRPVGTITINDDAGWVKVQYTCDIHIVDKDGNDLEGVTVTCEDKGSNQVFSVQTGADGKIAQQTITYKKWEGTDEAETEYSPHKFTFSKNGYTLLVMENITVDARITWDIEVKFPERTRARMANLGRLAILR